MMLKNDEYKNMKISIHKTNFIWLLTYFIKTYILKIIIYKLKYGNKLLTLYAIILQIYIYNLCRRSMYRVKVKEYI